VNDTNPFFRFVWRLNALILLGTAIIVSLIGLYALYELSKEYFEPRRNEAVALTPGQPDVPQVRATRTEFSQADILPGGAHALLMLHQEQDVDRGFSSGGKTLGAIRNLILLDLGSGAATNLMPDDQGVVLNVERFPKTNGLVATPVAGLVALVATKDSNADGRLSQDDEAALMAWPIGGKPRLVMDGITQLNASASLDGRIRLLVQLEGGMNRIDLDPISFETLGNQPMKGIGSN
jgi:hypothetical protein